MISLRIRYKILIAVGLAVTIGLVMIGVFYTDRQEQAVLAQNERTMRKLTESVIQGLQSVMLAGSADIAQSYADRLKKVTEVEDFRIMRITGEEAFRDNKTILEVNRRRGEEAFAPRDREDRFNGRDSLRSGLPVCHQELAQELNAASRGHLVSIEQGRDEAVRPSLMEADCLEPITQLLDICPADLIHRACPRARTSERSPACRSQPESSGSRPASP